MNLLADPVLTMLPSAFFTLLFGVAATHKFTSWRLFEQQVADYRVLPRAWATPAAVLIPIVEALLALGWLAEAERPLVAMTSALVLTGYGAAMEWNLVQGRDTIDCGCGGADGSQVIRPALVVRNLVLAALAVALALAAVFLPAPTRQVGWVDWISVLAGALALLGTYTTANQILANLPPQRVLD
jgi:hypothetical protein